MTKAKIIIVPVTGIQRYKDGFYFWDETHSFRMGPYSTEKQASKARSSYGAWLNKGIHMPVNHVKSWKRHGF